MARLGVGKIINVGGSVAVRLPSVLVNDDAFTFVEGMEVVVRIDKNTIVVEKA